ncbi:MAG: amidohydrolase [Oscillospiraceae bacterium]|nr:amidohydrolase [Oscillospiraceae bacterium]
MQVFDFHCHIYPDKIAERATMATGQFYDTHEPKCKGTVSDLLACCDTANICGALVQSVATTPSQVKSINEFIAKTVSEHPDRLIGFGTLHPESEDIEGDVKHLLELGLKGVKLHPDIQKFALCDPHCMELFEACADRLPFLVHAGDYRYQYSNPAQVRPVLDAFPHTTVIAAHLGGWSVWEEAMDAFCGKYEQLFVDSSSCRFVLSAQQYFDIIRRFGTDRVLFGSDYPMWNPKEELDDFLTLPFTDAEFEKILYQNAKTLLSL